jgi:hypothetical protein
MAQFNTRPEIAFQAVQGMQQADPLEMAGKAIGLRSMLNQQKMQGMQIQDAERQMQERTVVYETLGRHKGDVDKAMPELAGKVSPQTLKQLQDLAHASRQADSERIRLSRERGQQLGGILAWMSQQDDESYAKNYPQVMEDVLRIAPELAGKIPQGEMIPKSQLPLLAMGLATAEMVFNFAEEEHKRAKRPDELRKGKADADSAEADARIKAGEAEAMALYGPLDTKIADAKYRSLQQRLNSNQPITPQDQAWMGAYEKQKTIVTDRAGAIRIDIADRTGKRDDEFVDSYVEAVATGEIKYENVPMKLRGKVLTRAQDLGLVAMPRKVRDTIEAMDKAEGIINIIDSNIKKLKARSDAGQLLAGKWARVAATFQSDPDAQLALTQIGLLGNLARSVSGERGVLTDQDVERAMSLLPQPEDRADVAIRKIEQLRKFAQNGRNAAVKSATSKFTRSGERIGDNPPPSGAARPRARNAQGDEVEWDGQNWVPVKK